MNLLIKAGISCSIVVIGFILGGILKKAIIKLSKNISDVGALTFVGSCVSILTKIIAIVIALSTMGVNTNVIVGAFSAMGLGISLALKDSMANVAGGIQILFTHPFNVGDYIQVEGKEGTVTRIEMMFTVLLTPSSQEIVIPNSVLVSDVLVNYSRCKNRRIFITFPISIYADVDVLKQECFNVLNNDVDVLQDQTKDVCVESMDASNVNIGIYCWTEYDKYWDTLHRLNETIQKKRLEEGVVGSFESIHLK